MASKEKEIRKALDRAYEDMIIEIRNEAERVGRIMALVNRRKDMIPTVTFPNGDELSAKKSCWTYNGYHNANGYPVYNKEFVHRIFYSYFKNTKLKSTDVIRHMCNNPGCLNPCHLEIGTNRDNMRDRYIHGYYMPIKKLSKEQAKEIRELKALFPNLKNKDIAADYEIDHRTVSDILVGRYHADAGGPIKESTRVGNGRFSNTDIERMTKMFNDKQMTLKEISEIFGCSKSHVSRLIRNKHYKLDS